MESINRYFAEENPQGQEIAIDKGDNLENDYRYIIGMETPQLLDFDWYGWPHGVLVVPYYSENGFGYGLRILSDKNLHLGELWWPQNF